MIRLRHATFGLLIAALLPIAAASAQGSGDQRRELTTPETPSPRPERIVPPAQQPMIPPQKAAARPEIRAGIEQRPVDGGRARITVRVIAAEVGSAGKDPRLASLDLNLDTLPLRFGTYRLVEERTFELDWKHEAQVELPGGRSVSVTPREIGSDGRVHVRLQVLGSHPQHATRVQTDYSVNRGGTLMVGGFRLDPDHPEKGVMILAVTAK